MGVHIKLTKRERKADTQKQQQQQQNKINCNTLLKTKTVCTGFTSNEIFQVHFPFHFFSSFVSPLPPRLLLIILILFGFVLVGLLHSGIFRLTELDLYVLITGAFVSFRFFYCFSSFVNVNESICVVSVLISVRAHVFAKRKHCLCFFNIMILNFFITFSRHCHIMYVHKYDKKEKKKQTVHM